MAVTLEVGDPEAVLRFSVRKAAVLVYSAAAFVITSDAKVNAIWICGPILRE